jgi:hypothetical protein
LVWDHEEETAIQAPSGTGPKIAWSGPPPMPQIAEDRFHFHIAPTPGSTGEDVLDEVLALGATRLGIVDACPDAIALGDLDGNRFCLFPPTA